MEKDCFLRQSFSIGYKSEEGRKALLSDAASLVSSAIIIYQSIFTIILFEYEIFFNNYDRKV